MGDTYSIKSDSSAPRDKATFYVVDQLSGEVVSPPFATREAAWQLMQELDALPAEEQRLIRAGKRPAPGCEFLVVGGQ